MTDTPGEAVAQLSIFQLCEFLVRGQCDHVLGLWAHQQAKSLRIRMFLGSPKEPSAPFLNSPAYTTPLLCSWCQKHSQSSLLLNREGGREERKCVRFISVYLGGKHVPESQLRAESFPERGFSGSLLLAGHSAPRSTIIKSKHQGKTTPENLPDS